MLSGPRAGEVKDRDARPMRPALEAEGGRRKTTADGGTVAVPGALDDSDDDDAGDEMEEDEDDKGSVGGEDATLEPSEADSGAEVLSLLS